MQSELTNEELINKLNILQQKIDHKALKNREQTYKYRLNHPDKIKEMSSKYMKKYHDEHKHDPIYLEKKKQWAFISKQRRLLKLSEKENEI
jgi:hypothetical protein